MSVKPIIQLEQSCFYDKETILRKKSMPITHFDSNLRALVDDLIDTLNHHRIAVGLSAPQIGVLSRVTVINIKKKENKEPIIMINPQILKSGNKIEKKLEACMSLPYFQGEVERPTKVSVAYQNLSGEKQQLHGDGFLAKVIFHELDHLDGILYVDRMLSGDKLIPADFFRRDLEK